MLAVYSGPSKRRIKQALDRHRVVAGDLHVAAVRSRLQLGHSEMVELVDDEEQRQRHADGDGDEQAEAQPAGGGDRRHPELDAPEPPQAQPLGRLDQAEDGDDDHAAERRLGQVAEHPAEEQRAADGECGGDELAELGAGARRSG